MEYRWPQPRRIWTESRRPQLLNPNPNPNLNQAGMREEYDAAQWRNRFHPTVAGVRVMARVTVTVTVTVTVR